MNTHTAYIALGSNLNNPLRQVERAVTALQTAPQIRAYKLSSWYRNAAIATDTQPDYINGVIEVKTTASPHALLALLMDIEVRQGRVRVPQHKNAARIIDLDILLYGTRVVNSATLTVPHPRMTDRNFVLLPLLEIAPLAHLPSGVPLAHYRTSAHAKGKACHKLGAHVESPQPHSHVYV